MHSVPPHVRIDRNGTCLVFDLRNCAAEPVHVGEALPGDEDLLALCDAVQRGRHASQADRPAPRSLLPHTGWGHHTAPAVIVQRFGRPLTLNLALVAVDRSDDHVDFVHEDHAAGIAVTVSLAIDETGLVRSHSCLTNASADPVGLLALASLSLPLPSWASHATRYAGRWAAEMQQHRVRIEQGELASASHGGRPGFGGGNWIRIEAETLGEFHGEAIAAHLAWSGDHELKIIRDADGATILQMGARLDPGEIMLAPGERFETPAAFFAVSESGIARVRQAFHNHVTHHAIPDSAATQPRKVHINSWEALAFDQSVPRLTALADSAAALGVERFVLDDGWFKGRRDDSTSLGDWYPDPGIFPAGLSPLIDHVQALGMDFGLWVEPEMVSPDSDLYRAHSDWCLHLPDQPRPTQRHQLVLDLTRSEVCDYLFERIDALLSGNAIAYLKWDHNRELFPLAGKGHAQVLALYCLLDRLRTAHPGVEIETCASGGGRVDLEILKRCSRFWASDNNDAVERLRINAGWFDFLPMRIAGNHVGPSPNPITGRRLAMDFRAKVAMFGHMGVEADPEHMSPGERTSLAAHIALYKDWRDVLHGGRLIQLAGGEQGWFGWLALNGQRGLALIAQTRQPAGYDVPHVRLPGLDPQRFYRVSLLAPPRGKLRNALARPDRWDGELVLSGQALGRVGISLPLAVPETAWLVAIHQV